MEVNIEIKTLEIAGFYSVLQALRLPFGKDCRSIGSWSGHLDEWPDDPCAPIELHTECDMKICDKDITLMSTLVKRGDEHAKAIRGLIVYAEINAPRYLWSELDTYYIGSQRLSSESTMHIQGRGLNTEELVAMKEKLPEGTMQKRIQYFSYQTLRRIYYQRKDHRLPHWHKFCEWIEKLPFAKELILIKKDF